MARIRIFLEVGARTFLALLMNKGFYSRTCGGEVKWYRHTLFTFTEFVRGVTSNFHIVDGAAMESLDTRDRSSLIGHYSQALLGECILGQSYPYRPPSLPYPPFLSIVHHIMSCHAYSS